MFEQFAQRGTPVSVVPGFPFPTRLIESDPGTTVNASVTTLLRNNPNRVYWYIENIGSFQARVASSRGVSITYGRLLDSGGGWASAQASEDGDVTGWEVYGIANGGASAVYVVEIERVTAPGGG